MPNQVFTLYAQEVAHYWQNTDVKREQAPACCFSPSWMRHELDMSKECLFAWYAQPKWCALQSCWVSLYEVLWGGEGGFHNNPVPSLWNGAWKRLPGHAANGSIGFECWQRQAWKIMHFSGPRAASEMFMCPSKETATHFIHEGGDLICVKLSRVRSVQLSPCSSTWTIVWQTGREAGYTFPHLNRETDLSGSVFEAVFVILCLWLPDSSFHVFCRDFVIVWQWWRCTLSPNVGLTKMSPSRHGGLGQSQDNWLTQMNQSMP